MKTGTSSGNVVDSSSISEAITPELSKYVSLSGTQTITGAKTFNVSPTVPTLELSDANRMKAANVGMVMDAIGTSGSTDIDAEWLWLTTNASAENDSTVTAPSCICSQDYLTEPTNKCYMHLPSVSHSGDGFKMIIMNPRVSAFGDQDFTWYIQGLSDVFLGLGAIIGRCSAYDYRNKIIHFDGNGPYCDSLLEFKWYHPSYCTMFEAQDFTGTATRVPVYFSGLIVDKMDLRKCVKVTGKIVDRCRKYIDLRRMGKSDVPLSRLATNYDTDCIARFSDGYMKYNGSAWVDYTS